MTTQHRLSEKIKHTRYRSYHGHFRCDSTFPTQPLTFRDIWNPIAICAYRSLRHAREKMGILVHLDGQQDCIHHRKLWHCCSPLRHHRKPHTSSPRMALYYLALGPSSSEEVQ